MLRKMNAALNPKERLAITILIAAIALFFTATNSFKFGRFIERDSGDTSAVLSSEMAAVPIGVGDNIYAISNTKLLTPGKSALTLSSDSKRLQSYLRAQVIGYCKDQELLEVIFWISDAYDYQDQKPWTEFKSESLCLTPSSYISVSTLDNSYWDGNLVNGFRTSEWSQFVLPPFFVKPAPEPTPTAVSTKTEK